MTDLAMSFLTAQHVLVFLSGLLAGLLFVCWPLLRKISIMRATLEQLGRENAVLQAARQVSEDGMGAMRAEFRQLAGQVLEEKRQSFSQDGRQVIDSVLQPLREQIQGFQQRVNDIHDSSVRGQAELGAEIRRVLELGVQMNAEAGNLARALKGDNKAAGSWGEMQLERSLQMAGLLAGEHYQAQASLRDAAGNLRQPDFVIHLPDNKHIVIDSKVSLLDYDKAVAAPDEDSRQEALDAHARAVRQHIRDLASKDYSKLTGIRSPGFVLMFMPVESAYIQAMKHDAGLFEYACRKNVIPVSHTSLMPVLRTVANLWLLERSNAQARELAAMAGGLHEQVARVAVRLEKLGHSLQAVKNHFNQTVTAIAGQQGLYGKAERFAGFADRLQSELPDLQPVSAEVDTHRLQAVMAAYEEQSSGSAQGPDTGRS